MGSVLESTDVKNKLEDLSGVAIKPGENPFNALIEACNDDPARIQALYAAHRTKRNAQKKAEFLSPDFKELVIDPFLLRLENPDVEPGWTDPRYCMTFWGRPANHVLKLAGEIQQRLKACAPNVWLMPTYCMHLTVLELAFCRTALEIDAIKSTLRPAFPKVANYTYRHRARLVKPMISYDLAAFALSFLPACGEPVVSPDPVIPDTAEVLQQGDQYSYHHLRRDAWDLATKAGHTIESRYIVPSAHLTLGRFLTNKDHETPEQKRKWIETIDEINAWLESEVWGNPNSEFTGEWVVGQERGLDVRVGQLWYGGGRTVMLGEGF